MLADRVVQRLREAEMGLRRATRIDQVKLVADVAAAQYIFATRQRLVEEVIGYAREIKTFALARLGELLNESAESKVRAPRGQRRSRGGGSKGSKREPLPDAPPTLSDLGIDKKTSSVAQQLAKLPAKELKSIATGTTTLSKIRRQGKKAVLRQRADLPEAKFRVIYADPAWSYHDKADAGSVQVDDDDRTVRVEGGGDLRGERRSCFFG